MEKVEIVIKIPKYYLTHPQDYTCLAECVRRGVLLPKGHGRLKDENEIKQMIEDANVKNETSKIFAENIVRCTPTVIEADKEGEDDRD